MIKPLQIMKDPQWKINPHLQIKVILKNYKSMFNVADVGNLLHNFDIAKNVKMYIIVQKLVNLMLNLHMKNKNAK